MKKVNKMNQKELADKYHTCTCDNDLVSINWKSTKLIEIDFKNPTRSKPKGRIIWFLSNCLRCKKVILHGTSFCDYRHKGKELIQDGIKECKRYSCEDIKTITKKIKQFYEDYSNE